MKLFFLFNSSRPKYAALYRTLAQRICRQNGHIAFFGEVDRSQPLSTEQAVADACQQDCERIVVVGGDGSLHKTLNALNQLHALDQKELAIIPGGTCNDFARAMGFSPRRAEKAFQIACSASSRVIDVGQMRAGNDAPVLFINNAGFGRRVQPSVGRRIRPLRSLRSFRSNFLKLRWDNGQLEGNFLLGLVCNAPFFSGGLHFSKEMSITDGLLDIFLFATVPKWRLLPLIMAGKLGRPVRSRRVMSLRLRQLSIESDTDLWPQADGEPALHSTRQVRFEIAPQKIRWVTPVQTRLPLWTL